MDSAFFNHNLKFLLLTGLFLALVLLYGMFDPQLSVWFPKCPFHQLTGLECPGCGSQRAMHHLLQFDPVSAIKYNPLAVLFIPYILLGFYIESRTLLSPRLLKLRNTFFSKSAIYLILAAIILFWIGRNLL